MQASDLNEILSQSNIFHHHEVLLWGLLIVAQEKKSRETRKQLFSRKELWNNKALLQCTLYSATLSGIEHDLYLHVIGHCMTVTTFHNKTHALLFWRKDLQMS